MKIDEFEKLLWDRDGVRVVIRAPGWAAVEKPSQTNAADKNLSVTNFLKVRVSEIVGEYGCVVIDGSGQIVHGRTKLDRVRKSYVRD